MIRPLHRLLRRRNFTFETRFDEQELRLVEALLAELSSPNQPLLRVTRRVSGRAGYGGQHTSPEDFAVLATHLTGSEVAFADDGRTMSWRAGGEVWHFPSSRETRLLLGALVSFGYGRWLRAKYRLPGFVELEPGDRVVDCGSFVGGFAGAALDAGADEVRAVEPSAANRRCLHENVSSERLSVEACGLGATPATRTFHEVSSATDSTFLAHVDVGEVEHDYPVEVVRLDHLCAARGLDPTFVKIEAEGMEAEVIRGLGALRPAKIAVDGAPEGGSRGPRHVGRLLAALGYEVARDRKMVYARWPGRRRN